MGDEPKQKEPYREAPPPEERETERELAWLGTGKFWLVLLGAFVLVGAIFCVTAQRLTHPDAIVPVVTMSGPSEATKGQTVRYAVLVRDRFGAPLPRATVRVGFFKAELLELGRATTGDGGEASVEIRLPDDFAEQRTLVTIAEAGVAEARDFMLVSPKTPGKGEAASSRPTSRSINRGRSCTCARSRWPTIGRSPTSRASSRFARPTVRRCFARRSRRPRSASSRRTSSSPTK